MCAKKRSSRGKKEGGGVQQEPLGPILVSASEKKPSPHTRATTLSTGRKRKSPDAWAELSEKLVDNPDFFDLFVSKVLQANDSSEDTATALKDMLSKVARRAEGAKTFITMNGIKLPDAIRMFNLDYSDAFKIGLGGTKYVWDVSKDAVSEHHIVASDEFQLVLHAYGAMFLRDSEAVCRTAIDITIGFVLMSLRGISLSSLTNDRPMTPNFYEKIMIGGEIGISYIDRKRKCQFDGRVDYAVGFVNSSADGDKKQQFYSCLVVCEAKRSGALCAARGQLLSYMACIRARRNELKRKDVTTYGISSDGFLYQFIELQASGRVRMSRVLDVKLDLGIVLTTIAFILEQVANTVSSNNTPEKPKGELEVHVAEDLADDILELGASGYENVVDID